MVSHKQRLYNVISQEVSNNVLSVKLPKNRKTIPDIKSSIQHHTFSEPSNLNPSRKKQSDDNGRANIVMDNIPTSKAPEEEILLLRTKQEIAENKEEKHTLEIHFKAERSYIPLPDPGPPPPIIVPKQPSKKHAPRESLECECEEPPAPCACNKAKTKHKSKKK